ncbi:hypothetical protein [Micromonospora sp. NBC_00421]|uniref:hypothetical protein n=1 Tax=Micromonospora sp. NBC_00421 TaxID=2975976 RepID=UPI002E1DFE07
MPSPVVSEKRSPQLLTVLFWVGVALAPVAALILLLADGNGPLRFAAVLAITSVVLIGLSIALRADGGAGSSGPEALDEVEELRRELRSEIVAAAQRGNQALDQCQRTEEQVTALRRRLDAAAAGTATGGSPPAPDERAVGAGRARVPTVEPEPEAPVGRRRAVAEETPSEWERPDSSEPVAAGRGRAAADREAAEPIGRRYAPEPSTSDRAGVYGADAREPRGAVPPAGSSRPLGVVRHTETVHVTTRHTVVDGADPTGAAYGGGYAGRWTPGSGDSSWTGGEPERPWSGQAESADRGWSAPPDDRSRPARPAPRDERAWPTADPSWAAPPAADPSWSAPADDRPELARPELARPELARPEPARSEPARSERSPVGGEADAWPGSRTGWARAEPPSRAGQGGGRRAEDRGEPPLREVRAGDRWAEVRDDGRAREVRVGERRAEVHADGAGYHYSDRWASVRQEEPHRDEAHRDEAYRDEAYRDESHRNESHREERFRDVPRRSGPDRTGEQWDGGRSARDDRPALPAGGVPVPQQWREPARGHRPAEEWTAQPVQTTEEWPARVARPVRTGQDRPARAEDQPAQGWPTPTGQPAQDWPAQADGQRWGGQPAEPRRDREPVVSWRTPEPEPEPEPHGRRQWGGEQRYGYPPQDDAPRAGGHWR